MSTPAPTFGVSGLQAAAETKTVQPLSASSAGNAAARWRLGRPPPPPDVGDNLQAHTWPRPGPRPAPRPSRLRGGAAPKPADAPPPRQELAARRGSGSEGCGDGSGRFDTLCLNFNDLIKDFNSAVNSANEPGAASES